MGANKAESAVEKLFCTGRGAEPGQGAAGPDVPESIQDDAELCAVLTAGALEEQASPLSLDACAADLSPFSSTGASGSAAADASWQG